MKEFAILFFTLIGIYTALSLIIVTLNVKVIRLFTVLLLSVFSFNTQASYVKEEPINKQAFKTGFSKGQCKSFAKASWFVIQNPQASIESDQSYSKRIADRLMEANYCSDGLCGASLVKAIKSSLPIRNSSILPGYALVEGYEQVCLKSFAN